jgi:membrane associated rhomboid family serine protease
VFFPRARIVVMVPILFLPFFFEVPAVVYLLFWALSQVFIGTLALAGPEIVGGVAWWAHVGGFAAGLFLLPLFLQSRRVIRRFQPDEYGTEGAWM